MSSDLRLGETILSALVSYFTKMTDFFFLYCPLSLQWFSLESLLVYGLCIWWEKERGSHVVNWKTRKWLDTWPVRWPWGFWRKCVEEELDQLENEVDFVVTKHKEWRVLIMSLVPWRENLAKIRMINCEEWLIFGLLLRFKWKHHRCLLEI